MNEQRESNLDFLLTVAGMMKIVFDSKEVLGIDRYYDRKIDKSIVMVHMTAEGWHKYFETPDVVIEDRHDNYRELIAHYRGLRFFCLEDQPCE